ncbi:hypothetical protein CDL15_Pgr019407 [Punica granatum]|uniref:Uncharacterized protein n=1 Tax=Punica granatum TaxID=22663 RepID=A0A218XS93_PUNGR|nr:hypothetical protein CDL15_Pgr019407 [Punica granatum]PKI71853.1 hypothetical protein CRG98_007712 [Punica granatum]
MAIKQDTANKTLTAQSKGAIACNEANAIAKQAKVSIKETPNADGSNNFSLGAVAVMVENTSSLEEQVPNMASTLKVPMKIVQDGDAKIAYMVNNRDVRVQYPCIPLVNKLENLEESSQVNNTPRQVKPSKDVAIDIEALALQVPSSEGQE